MEKNKSIGELAIIFLNFRDIMKIYHWQTKSYARHKASCSLIEGLDEKTDRFIEVMSGSRNSRPIIPNEYQTFTLENQTDDSALKLLYKFKSFLENVLPKYLSDKDTELLNIRDEILADVNQALYLFTFH